MEMFGPAEDNADEKWAQDWKNLGVMPEITVEEKIAQGKALQFTESGDVPHSINLRGVAEQESKEMLRARKAREAVQAVRTFLEQETDLGEDIIAAIIVVRGKVSRLAYSKKT